MSKAEYNTDAMKSTTLVKLLGKHGKAAKAGGSITFSDAKRVSLYVNTGAEALLIAEIASILVEDNIIQATTRKGDFFVVDIVDVRVLRVQAINDKMKTGLIR